MINQKIAAGIAAVVFWPVVFLGGVGLEAHNAHAAEMEELIMWPTQYAGCYVVDLDYEAQENGGELSDEEQTLADELNYEEYWTSTQADDREMLYSPGCGIS